MTGQTQSSFLTFRISALIAIIAIALAPCLVFGPALINGKTIGPFDQMAHMVPGAPTVTTDRTWDILQADGALQFYGWRDLVFEAHRNGWAPFWNPYQLGGTPLLANSQSAPYYPLHVLFGKLGVHTALAIVLLAWIHLAVAGLGTFALARRLGAGIEGAFVGGFALALSPFALSWSALGSVMTTCCWIPVLLAAQHSLTQKPSLKTALSVTGAATMMLTGGHLQFIFYGMLAWFIFSVGTFLTSDEKAKVPISATVTIVTIGFAFFAALPQINPALEFSKLSHRKATATEDGYKAYASSAIQPWEFLGTLTPVFMGQPGKPDAQDVEEKIPSTWNMFVKPGGNYAESAIWLGVTVALLLCMLGRKQNYKLLAPTLAITLVGLLLATGTPLAKLFYFGIPGFSSTGSPGRAAILFVIGACVLAALAAPKSPEESDKNAKAFPYFGLLALALLTILASTQLGGLKSWLGFDVSPIIARRMTEAIPILLVSLFAAAGAWYCWAKRGWMALGTLCAVSAHLFSIQTQILPFSTPPKPFLQSDVNVRSAYINQNWDFFNPPLSGVMPPNYATILRSQDIGGYDSLMAATTVDILRSVNNGQDPAPPTNGNMMFVKRDPNLEALADAGVTQVYSKFPIEGLEEIEALNEVRVYSVPGPGIVHGGKITELNTEGFRAILDEDSPHNVTVRFANLPGWTVTSRTTEKFDYQSRILPGQWLTAEANPDKVLAANRYDFKFTPPGYLPWPLLPTFIGILALGALILRPKSQQNSENPVQSSIKDSE